MTPVIEGREVNSIEELVRVVKKDYKSWRTKTFPWFRGEPRDYGGTALVPKVYRDRKSDGTCVHNENRLLQKFRMKAPFFAGSIGLRNDDNDKLLFLAQHVGLPTRLLDWTEGLLASLCFAVRDMKDGNNGVVWMLDPVALNNIAQAEKNESPFPANVFPLTWFSPEKAYARREDMLEVAHAVAAGQLDQLIVTWVKNRIGLANISAAWEFQDEYATRLPVAVHPTNIHARHSAQRACFTVQGKEKSGLHTLIGPSMVKKYSIPWAKVDSLKRDLRLLGVTSSTLFPDLDNLAKDLTEEDLLA